MEGIEENEEHDKQDATAVSDTQYPHRDSGGSDGSGKGNGNGDRDGGGSEDGEIVSSPDIAITTSAVESAPQPATSTTTTSDSTTIPATSPLNTAATPTTNPFLTSPLMSTSMSMSTRDPRILRQQQEARQEADKLQKQSNLHSTPHTNENTNINSNINISSNANAHANSNSNSNSSSSSNSNSFARALAIANQSKNQNQNQNQNQNGSSTSSTATTATTTTSLPRNAQAQRDTDIQNALRALMSFMASYTNLTTEQELLQRRLASVDADMAKVARRVGGDGAPGTSSTSNGAANEKPQYPSFVATAKASQIRAREKLERVNKEIEVAEQQREVVLAQLTAVFLGALGKAGGNPPSHPLPAPIPTFSIGMNKKDAATETTKAVSKIEKDFSSYKTTVEERISKLEESLASKHSAFQDFQSRESKREKKVNEIDKDLNSLWDRRNLWKENVDGLRSDMKREFNKIEDRMLAIEKKNVVLLDRAEDSETRWRVFEREQRDEIDGVKKKVMQAVKDIDTKVVRLQAERSDAQLSSSLATSAEDSKRLENVDKQVSEILAKMSRLEQTQIALEKRLAELDARSKLPTRPPTSLPPHPHHQQQSTATTDSTLNPSPVSSNMTAPSSTTPVPFSIEHITTLKAVQSDIVTLDKRYQDLQSSAEEKDRIFADTFDEVNSRVERLQKNITSIQNDMSVVRKDVENVFERQGKQEKEFERIERETKEAEKQRAKEKAARLNIQTQAQNQGQGQGQGQGMISGRGNLSRHGSIASIPIASPVSETHPHAQAAMRPFSPQTAMYSRPPSGQGVHQQVPPAPLPQQQPQQTLIQGHYQQIQRAQQLQPQPQPHPQPQLQPASGPGPIPAYVPAPGPPHDQTMQGMVYTTQPGPGHVGSTPLTHPQAQAQTQAPPQQYFYPPGQPQQYLPQQPQPHPQLQPQQMPPPPAHGRNPGPGGVPPPITTQQFTNAISQMAYQQQQAQQHRALQSPGIVHDLTASPLHTAANLPTVPNGRGSMSSAGAGPGTGANTPPLKSSADTSSVQVLHLSNKIGTMEAELKACWNGVRNLAVRFDNMTSEPIVKCMGEKIMEMYPHAHVVSANERIKKALEELEGMKGKMGVLEGKINSGNSGSVGNTAGGGGMSGQGQIQGHGRGRAQIKGHGDEVWNELQMETARLDREVNLANSGVDEVRMKLEVEMDEVRAAIEQYEPRLREVGEGLKGVKEELREVRGEVEGIVNGGSRKRPRIGITGAGGAGDAEIEWRET